MASVKGSAGLIVKKTKKRIKINKKKNAITTGTDLPNANVQSES